jgi:O-antigen/teichoic acid export membrane protein
MSNISVLNFKNSSIFIISAAGKYILNFISLFIFARILSPSDYGYWIQLLAIFSIIQFFIECGQLNILLSKTKNFDDIFTDLLTWNIFLILATYLFVFPLTMYLLGSENYSINIYMYLFLSLPMTLFANLLFARAQSQQRFVMVNIVPFFVLVLGFLAALFYIYFIKISIDALAFKILIESITSITLAFYFTRSYLFERFPKKLKIKSLFNSSNIYTAIGDLAIKSSNQIDKIFLSVILPPSFLGFYSRAYAIGLIGVAIGGYSLTTLGIQASAKADTNNKKNFISMYLVFLAILSFHLLFNYSDYILLIILGNNWIEFVSLGWIIALMPAMKFFENYFYISCIAAKRTKLFSYLFLLIYIISILIALYLYSIKWDISNVIFAFFASGLVLYLIALTILFSLEIEKKELINFLYSISSVIIYVAYRSFVMGWLIVLKTPFHFIIIIDLIICTACIISFLYVTHYLRRFL